VVRRRNGATTMELEEDKADLREVDAGWWRKPHWLEVSHADVLTARSIRDEALRVLEQIAGATQASMWLNSPDYMHRAANKFRQFERAKAVGFLCPPTAVNNSCASVGDQVGDDLAFKAIGGTVERASGGTRTLFTTRLGPVELMEARQESSPFPGVFQTFIDKRCEWRVTVVEGAVCSAAVETTGMARVDSRSHQMTNAVQFRRVDLPTIWQDAILELVRSMGLGFAAIDLTEAHDGTLWFLEMNPNGHYLWLEESLGLAISSEIANRLGSRQVPDG